MYTISDTHLHKDWNFTYHFCSIKNYDSGEHNHTFYEYFFVISGTALHIYNGQQYVLSKGDLFFIEPNDWHTFVPIEGQDCEWVNVAFISHLIDKAFAYLEVDKHSILQENRKPFRVKLSDYSLQEFIRDHEYLNVIYQLHDNLEMPLHFKKLLLKVIGLLVTRHEQLNRHQEYRQQQGYTPLFETLGNLDNLKVLQEGVPALVRMSGFSHGYLCRVMKEHLNTSPSQYITDLRLAYASNLLLNSDLNIADIAARVGYFSLSHFIKLFKAKYACTPYRYRQKYQVKK